MEKTKKYIWIGMIVLFIIFGVVFVSGIKTPLDFISHKVDLIINQISEEEYCIQTKDFIDRTYEDGICDENENPFNSADCCLDRCITQEYEWWCK
ncbi:MAG: hypothetical protein ACFFCM_07480 [Promethearchaeota archaeon]